MTRMMIVSFLALTACTSDDMSAPAAPTALVAAPLAGGAHLTWTDNSDDELEFVIMRQRDGLETTMTELARVPFDTAQFHDAPLVAGGTYMYMVMAMNHGGDAESNHVLFTAP